MLKWLFVFILIIFVPPDNLKRYELSAKLLEGSAEPALSVIYSSASRPSYKASVIAKLPISK